MQLEDQQRFEVWGIGRGHLYGAIVLKCRRCGEKQEIETTDDTIVFAELNQRADEHTEGCR